MDDAHVDAICERLIYAGWELMELERLSAFLGAYMPTEEDRSEFEIRQLEFLRYLVQTGKLIA